MRIRLATPKEVGKLPTKADDELKRTNEIKMVQPLLANIAGIQGNTITADALLAQRSLARYLVEECKTRYLFTVKGNQATLLEDLKLFFKDRQDPDYVDHAPLEDDRIDTRKSWTISDLYPYLDFPNADQAFVIEHDSIEKKTGKETHNVAYDITSRPRIKPQSRICSPSSEAEGS